MAYFIKYRPVALRQLEKLDTQNSSAIKTKNQKII